MIPSCKTWFLNRKTIRLNTTFEIQHLANHITSNGLSLPLKKIEATTNQKLNEFLLINKEKYVVAAYVFLKIVFDFELILNFQYGSSAHKING